MTIKAVFSDMDGTLLGPDSHISDYTASVLKKMKEKGIHFILCTGRPYADVFCTIRKCQLEPDFIITSNGGRIHDGQLQLVAQHNIPTHLVERVVRVHQDTQMLSNQEEERKFTTNVYREAVWMTDKVIPAIRATFAEEFPCVELGAELYDLSGSQLEGVHEAFFLGHRHDLEPLNTHMQTHYADQLQCCFATPMMLDCVPAGVTKGNGVREVAKLLGLDLEEVACFGDGMNDESMLQIAGRAFIMGNAQEELKRRVARGEVIGSNAEDSVARKLEELFLCA